MVACNAIQVKKPVNGSARITRFIKNGGFLSGTSYFRIHRVGLVRCIGLLDPGQKLLVPREVTVKAVGRYHRALAPEHKQYQGEIGGEPQ